MSDPLEILPEPRAGDEMRIKVADRISSAYARGYITKQVHDARLEALDRARTLSELLLLARVGRDRGGFRGHQRCPGRLWAEHRHQQGRLRRAMTMTMTRSISAGAQVLAGYHGEMVHYMIAEYGAAPDYAEAAVSQLWTRWVLRCALDHDMDTREAAAAVTAGLAFLADTETHSPSRVADAGWHTMLSYTREYAALCHALRGKFIHHCPSDVAGVAQKGYCTDAGCDDRMGTS